MYDACSGDDRGRSERMEGLRILERAACRLPAKTRQRTLAFYIAKDFYGECLLGFLLVEGCNGLDDLFSIK
jgi:hypothetical protein